MATIPLNLLAISELKFDWFTAWLVVSMLIGIIWQATKIKNLITNTLSVLFGNPRKKGR